MIWQNCLSVNERASEFSEMSVRQRVSYLGVTYLESLHPKTAVTGRDLAERHLPIYRFTNVTSVPRQQFSGLGVVGQPVHPSPTALLSPAIISKIDGCIIFEFELRERTQIQIEFKLEKGNKIPKPYQFPCRT